MIHGPHHVSGGGRMRLILLLILFVSVDFSHANTCKFDDLNFDASVEPLSCDRFVGRPEPHASIEHDHKCLVHVIINFVYHKFPFAPKFAYYEKVNQLPFY